MSVEIWPPIAPEQLKIEEDATQARELQWLLHALHSTLRSLKSSLEDVYALLAPIDPGSTLVVSTHRNEAVKGTITRVGTRLVKGTMTLKLRTLPPTTLSLDPARPVHITELATLNTLLTQSVDLLALCVTETPEPRFLSDQLRLLSEYLAESLSLIKGPSLDLQAPSDTRWTSHSVPPACFSPPLAGNLSAYLTVQDASLVLFIRALEPAEAPVNFGTRLALAIGTARRLEHDEADRVFGFCPEGADDMMHTPGSATHSSVTPDVQRGRSPNPGTASIRSGVMGGGMGKGRGTEVQVYVREKVRVESADPSLMSLSVKLGALGHTLNLARRNLAAVMGEEFAED